MHLLLFGKKGNHRTIIVPIHRPWVRSVALVTESSPFKLDIPNTDTTIQSGGGKSELSRWMPFHEHNFLAMTLEDGRTLINTGLHWYLRHLPQSQCSIARCCGKHIVMERREVHIHDGTRMTLDQRSTCIWNFTQLS